MVINRFQYISKNLRRIKKEVRIGLVSTCLLWHYALYCRYDFHRRTNSVVDSVLYVSEDFKVSETLVYKIKKEMEEAI